MPIPIVVIHPPRFTGAQAFGVVKQFQRLAGISRMHFDPSCGRQGDDRIRIEFQRTARKFSGAPGIHLQLENCVRRHPKDIAIVLAKFDGARSEPTSARRIRRMDTGKNIGPPSDFAQVTNVVDKRGRIIAAR